MEDNSKIGLTEPPTHDNEKEDVSGGQSLKARLVTMARKALQVESPNETSAGGPVTDLDQLMERQDWLDEMRSESQKPNKKDDLPVFKSVCHGQPWAGNVYFRYEVDSNGEKVPVDAIFTDFQSCSYGRTGQDIAHFLLASTTREFRQNHLESILQAYLTELEDVITHLGVFDGPLYTTTALRQDYRRGIYMGITFCLFAMPMLSNRSLDSDANEEIDGDVVDSAPAPVEMTEIIKNYTMER